MMYIMYSTNLVCELVLKVQPLVVGTPSRRLSCAIKFTAWTGRVHDWQSLNIVTVSRTYNARRQARVCTLRSSPERKQQKKKRLCVRRLYYHVYSVNECE